MRRADRLFRIVQILRRRRVTTARRLAEELEVSERTIYRDIRDLSISGVPIEGEAGVGYALPRGFDMPPLMFTEDEIEALVLGARMVRAWGDRDLVRAADDVVAKVEAVVPPRLRERIGDSRLFSLNFQPRRRDAELLALLRHAIRERRKVTMEYTRADGEGSERTVRPLCLAFTPPEWMVTGWCELRDDFRNFRLDRIEAMSVLDEGFVEEPGKGLDDFLDRVTGRRE